MLCYKGRSWCSASPLCATAECDRKVTDEVRADAAKWWGEDGAPFSYQDYSTRCGEFQPIEKETSLGAA